MPIVTFAISVFANNEVVPMDADPASVAMTMDGNVIAVCNLEYNFSDLS
jgi:hypothetical protein